jgi:hypothetical protein
MSYFIDEGIKKLERQTATASIQPDDTILIDAYRQGTEVNLVKYFMRSTIPYMSSKGLGRSTINDRLVPELDMRDLGQQVEINNIVAFEDSSERVSARDVLINNMIYQSEVDPLHSVEVNDGRIAVFSDSGKIELANQAQQYNARGVRGSITSVSISDTYTYNADVILIFEDGVGKSLNVTIPGFIKANEMSNPFIEKDNLTNLGTLIEYTYISPNEKTFSRGFSYYGSDSGTDSVSFGGLLR